MRYLIITYYKKANGQTDEAMSVAKNLRARDIQTATVILDFKKLEVTKASMGGVNVPKNFDNIVSYYMQHYENIITRLFNENGYEVNLEKNEETTAGISEDDLAYSHADLVNYLRHNPSIDSFSQGQGKTDKSTARSIPTPGRMSTLIESSRMSPPQPRLSILIAQSP
jgi:hypothetical protein